ELVKLFDKYQFDKSRNPYLRGIAKRLKRLDKPFDRSDALFDKKQDESLKAGTEILRHFYFFRDDSENDGRMLSAATLPALDVPKESDEDGGFREKLRRFFNPPLGIVAPGSRLPGDDTIGNSKSNYDITVSETKGALGQTFVTVAAAETEESEEPYGAILLGIYPDPTEPAEINFLHVLKDERGKHIGSAILSRAIQETRKYQVKIIEYELCSHLSTGSHHVIRSFLNKEAEREVITNLEFPVKDGERFAQFEVPKVKAEKEVASTIAGGDVPRAEVVSKTSLPALANPNNAVTATSLESLLKDHLAGREVISYYDFGARSGKKTKYLAKVLREISPAVNYAGLEINRFCVTLAKKNERNVERVDILEYFNNPYSLQSNKDLITILCPELIHLANFVEIAKQLVAQDGLVLVTLMEKDWDELTNLEQTGNDFYLKRIAQEMVDFQLVRFSERNPELAEHTFAHPFMPRGLAFVYSPNGVKIPWVISPYFPGQRISATGSSQSGPSGPSFASDVTNHQEFPTADENTLNPTHHSKTAGKEQLTQKVHELVVEHPELSQRAIAGQLSTSPRTIGRIITRLTETDSEFKQLLAERAKETEQKEEQLVQQVHDLVVGHPELSQNEIGRMLGRSGTWVRDVIARLKNTDHEFKQLLEKRENEAAQQEERVYQQIHNLVVEHPKLTQNEIGAITTLSQTTVSEIIAELKEADYVFRELLEQRASEAEKQVEGHRERVRSLKISNPGLTQHVIAKQVGISQSLVSEIITSLRAHDEEFNRKLT
ncbi:MAG: GNAT family N-acetyltransferase, partial [Acidobacteriota bacterium]|nr:GNAT family N-acetyltransferase [Acidobacteriota bacterium]